MNVTIYTEIFELFQILGEEYRTKIPQKIWDYIEKNKSNNYNKFEVQQNLWNGKISKDALDLYSALNFQYLLEDEFEKKMLSEIYNYNGNNAKTIKKIDINMHYLNDIFENNNNNKSKENLELTVLRKETFFDKILKKIKEFFKKI